MALKCNFPGCTFSTKTKNTNYVKQELARHMRFTHGQPGASASSKTMQAKKLELQYDKVAHPDSAEITNPSTEVENASTTTAKASKRIYNKSLREDDSRTLIFVGRLIAYCEQEAERLGNSKEHFTKRCATLFYASQVG